MKRRAFGGGAVALLSVFLSSFLLAGDASAQGPTAPAPASLRGKVVVSDVLIAPSSEFNSSAVMVAALKRVERPVVDGTGDFWRFHFVAFLEPQPETSALRVVASDVTEPRHPRMVKVFEVAGQPGASELRVTDFVVTSAMGFERGHKYELTVTRGDDDAVGGHGPRKEDVYARGVVTLR